MLRVAHIGGLPIEEALLALLPTAGLLLAGIHAGTRKLRRRFTPVRRHRAPVQPTYMREGQ
jgi:hypothetical protein